MPSERKPRSFAAGSFEAKPRLLADPKARIITLRPTLAHLSGSEYP